ncbi:YfbU family protein [Macrococcus armenti]|uniref:YfbU family protein n=1 Tax=Macrococcus armenti TaxID=2875764 RepID=UPI001CC960F9|nr:YfbU family protein [Macrococcus armenti]UBH08588.1 YfbU family protein [Macrococcus armenti]UBH10885.1 YfbU family protein [Macrococcus armenti]UBH15367.1 YfbU family protein [Macrococcus armenti]UBH17724.1 YfbU family protein [Macrococcus armenti]UBH19992.1 YfbU family protein [Macrococcus armenti]
MNDITQNNFNDDPESKENYPYNRLLLFKMYQILEKVDLPNAELHCFHKNILKECREEQYPLLFEELTLESEKILTSVMRTVEYIIMMYVHLTKSYKTLSNTQQIQIEQHPYSNFIGFSLNYESDYEVYANYYLTELMSYDHILNLEKFHTCKTKPQSLTYYKKMIDRYKKYQINTYLTYQEIREILG